MMSYSPAYHYSQYLAALDGRFGSHKTPEFVKLGRLRSMSAWVVRDTANGVLCLQSYATIVSCVFDGEAIRLGNWSVTTSKHQSFFAREWRQF